MKTEGDFRRILNKITLTFQPWVVDLRADNKRWYLQIRDPNGTCNTTGNPMPWSGRKWMLSLYMTDTEVVMTAFKAYMAAVEHEAREGFKYDGLTIFDPHINVEDLARLRRGCPLDGRREE